MMISKSHLCVMIVIWTMAGNATSVAQNVLRTMGNARILIAILWIYEPRQNLNKKLKYCEVFLMADVKKIQAEIIEKAAEMAKEIKRGKDIEIKTSNGGLKILAVDKKVVR